MLCVHVLLITCFTPHDSGKPCITQLLTEVTAVNSWTKSLEENYAIDVIYFDFAKAFDSVPHKHLLVKLESYGIFGSLLGWLRSFLFGRR